MPLRPSARRWVCTVALSLLPANLWVMAFDPPGPTERLRAIGPTDGLPATLRQAFEPGPHFKRLAAPGPVDWLAQHAEPGQTFAQFAAAKPRRPTPDRQTLYLLPLGELGAASSPPLEALQEYTSLFFGLPVKTLPVLDVASVALTTRTNAATRKRQLLTTDILALLKPRLPLDAFCLVAVTMEDLYPEASWNFVFGQASLTEGVGVYSLARYDPGFFGQPRMAEHATVMLRRSCKVLTHEIGHVFGLLHCIYFECLINGSNHLTESDARPMHLCPVCLRKLHSSIGFDLPRRYDGLARFYEAHRLAPEADWVRARLAPR